MARRTTTVLGPDGAPVVRHVAEQGREAASLRREATVLELARGPGVVDLVAAGDESDGGAWLCTRYLAGGTLTDVLRAEGEPAATAALARVAGALADLHDRGIVHGRCTADHVVGGASEASLCGFSAATAAALDGAADPLVDRRGFASLVESTLRSDADAASRARRAVAGLAEPRHGTSLRAVAAELRALARDSGWVDPVTPGPQGVRMARAAGDTPDEEPTRVLRRPVPRPGGGRPGSKAAVRAGAGRSGRLALAAAAVAGCLALVGGLVVRQREPPPVARSLEPMAAPAPRPTTTVTTGAAGRTPERVWPPEAPAPQPTAGPGGLQPPGEAGAAGPGHHDPDPTVPEGTGRAPDPGRAQLGSGRPTPAPSRPAEPRPATVGGGARPSAAPAQDDGRGQQAAPQMGGAGGAVLEHEGMRYEVGGPGEIVVLGDWDCDGTPTPSVVRPADGSVWTFPRWTTGPEVVVARALGTAPSPVAAAARPEPSGCDVLAITTAAGDEVIVRPTAGGREH